MTRARRGVVVGLALMVAFGPAAPVLAANELSTDVTADLEGTLAADHDAVEDTGSGAPAKIDLGALPAAADVSAYSVATNGDVLFALDAGAELSGAVVVTARDVVRWDGAVYTVELAGAGHGIPAGARIDAIGVVQGDLLLSFDVGVTLGNVTAADEDLVRLESTQPDVWSLFFDGSAAGVPVAADLDGADLVDASGRLALSFDVSGTVGGVAFADEDVLEYDPDGGAWSKRLAGASRFPALVAADVDALFVPEPDAAALAAGAAGALLALRRRRCALALQDRGRPAGSGWVPRRVLPRRASDRGVPG